MTMDLSIIVPLFNEEENVHLMHQAIVDAVRPLGLRTEILFVDDGSRDATFARCLEMQRALPPVAEGEPHLRLVKLRRNYGQTAAMAAGIEQARGRVLITMDGDLQNDPGDIPLFLEKIEEGYDLVVGWRHQRKDHWSRVLPSKVANWLIGKITGVPIKDNGCSLKAYRADLIKEIPLYAEMHRFIPAMASLGGASIAEIKVRHHPRRFGQSKYGFSRIYKVFADLITIRTILSFARRPMVWLGGAAGLAGLAGLAALVAALTFIDDPRSSGVVFQGLSMLFGALMFFMLFLGFLCQLIYGVRAPRLHAFRRLAARPVLTGTDGAA
ncbi:glycosyltransferase family 2 protein [Geminicoccaceae bacterium 1502E]|nr:glycosyltransferase family 2 protein [Geminicoccaceae bacterium 1502E]